MALQQIADTLIEHVKSHEKLLHHNKTLFQIYEGLLLPFIEEDLREQLSLQSFNQARHRIAPINVLIKIIDKLSKIYQQNPSRRAVGPVVQESDEALLSWYIQNTKIDQKMNISNEFFNLFKNNLVQVFLNQRVPQIRAIPSDRFMVFSNDPVDPTRVTHVVVIQGEERSRDGSKTIFHVYSDEEFLIVDSSGEVRADLMMQMGNPEGINEIGKMPFVYVNRSQNLLIPLVDTDTLKMTKLLPILLSDLNYAVMFQSFSIIYAINATEDKLEKSPNSFWRLKSDDPDVKPEIGMIKPQVDITETMSLIQGELSFWLNSKGIRPGAVGQLTGESFQSGISKMIDEMDTSEERRKQVQFYEQAEAEMWDYIVNFAHPYWLDKGLIDVTQGFSPQTRIVTDFAEQLPMIRRGEVIKNLSSEVEQGFISKKRAIKKLNPGMTDDEVEELLSEIEEEKGLSIDLERASGLAADQN